MIVEWIRHRLTPAPRALRDMGYLRELIAIDARRRRHRRAWAPHLRATQGMILDRAARLDRWDRVVVVGAAQTADIPLDLLALLFRRVVLVDLLFLPSVHISAVRMPPVVLTPFDVTGVVDAIRTLPQGAPLPETHPAIPEIDDADLVISCNVLSQLPIVPCQWLERRHGMDTKALEPFRRRLITDHLRLLSQAPCPVCLITDTEDQAVVADQAVESHDLLHGIKPEVEGDSWWWAIAPRPEQAWTHDVRHRVIGGWLRGFSTPDGEVQGTRARPPTPAPLTPPPSPSPVAGS